MLSMNPPQFSLLLLAVLSFSLSSSALSIHHQPRHHRSPKVPSQSLNSRSGGSLRSTRNAAALEARHLQERTSLYESTLAAIVAGLLAHQKFKTQAAPVFAVENAALVNLGLNIPIIPLAISVNLPLPIIPAPTPVSVPATTPPVVSTTPRPTSTPAPTSTPTPASSTSVTSSLSQAPPPQATSPFSLTRSHSGSSFLDGWDFFTYPDPTHGQVNFVDQTTAHNAGLVYTSSNGSTVMRVDDYTWLPQGANRNSVRITSKETFGIGSLIVLDAVKMPYGPSVWPAFWSVGADWPAGGEIDIVEGVHNSVQNQYTLHTNAGCSLQTPMSASGKVLSTTCDSSNGDNSGCGVQDPSKSSFGSGWNAAGGGVYAMYWSTSGISMWSFNRNNIPKDLSSEQPDTSTWGAPNSFWSANSCDMNKYFSAQTLVFDITLCGDWAGATYNQAGFSGSCSSAVADPRNYQYAAFEVNYVKVYTAK